MLINAIVAMSENRVIGNKGQLPWHLPADLQHFKMLTLGKPIIMGRRTHDSINRALPGRRNIVMTRDPQYRAPGCMVVSSLAAALTAAADSAEVFIIGGEQLYRESLPVLNRIYLTLIHHVIAGDTFFPILPSGQWREVAHQSFEAGEGGGYAYSFITLERRPVPASATPAASA